jgi:hypothetical protein
MEGGLFLIFVIIALVARAIEAMTKGQKRPPQQPPQRRPRPEYERPHGTTRRAPPQLPQPRPRDQLPADATEDAAAEMIPDELWEILTGRPKPRRAPQPVPEPEWDEEADRSEAESLGRQRVPDEEAEYERRRRADEERRAREARELMERRQRGREAHTADKAPAVVSLEQPVLATAARHAAFHEKVDVRPLQVAKPRPRSSPRQRLFTGNDLKRAIVLHEVLGKPRALDDW